MVNSEGSVTLSYANLTIRERSSSDSLRLAQLAKSELEISNISNKDDTQNSYIIVDRTGRERVQHITETTPQKQKVRITDPTCIQWRKDYEKRFEREALELIEGGKIVFLDGGQTVNGFNINHVHAEKLYPMAIGVHELRGLTSIRAKTKQILKKVECRACATTFTTSKNSDLCPLCSNI